MPKAGNRIALIRKKAALTQEELADRVGSHRVTIANLERGDQELTQTWMVRIAEALHVEPQDLIAETGETVMVIGKVQAGSWAEHPQWESHEHYPVVMPSLPGWTGVAKKASVISGSSMNELYPDGSIVVWAPFAKHAEELRQGRRYIVERERHGSYEVTLKEFRIDDKGREWLVPRTTDPSEQTPLPLDCGDGETIRIIGRVIWGARMEEQ